MESRGPPSVASPRLAEYRRRASKATGRDASAAWRQLASHGLPLVDPLPDDGSRLSVTFVWRPDRRVSSASIYTPVANPLRGETDLLPLGPTGVWYRTLALPRRTRALYAYTPRPTPTPDNGGDWGAYFRSLLPDPHNPSSLVMAKDPDDPEDVSVTVSVVALPDAPPLPWSRVRHSEGWTMDHVRLRSRSLEGVRSVWVYTPPGFSPRRTRYNLVLAFDGVAYQSAVPTPTIVGNLVDAGRIGPSVIVLVGSAPGSREADLLPNPKFLRFLASELVPWMQRRYGLRVPPARSVLVGSSLGGLTAAFAALRHPDLFGNVLAQSGAFTWSDSGDLLGAPTLMEQYARAPRRPIRFYLDAGSLETTVFPGTQMSPLSGVRHFRDVLVAKGYPVSYAEFEGGHDYACWGGTLADGLLSLLGKPGAQR